MAKKTFSGEIDEALVKQWGDFIDSMGYVKYRAIEAAFRAFMAMPRDVQVKLMESDSSNRACYQILIDGLQSAEIDRHLSELGPVKAELLALLKEAKGRSSQAGSKKR